MSRVPSTLARAREEHVHALRLADDRLVEAVRAAVEREQKEWDRALMVLEGGPPGAAGGEP